MYTTLDFSFITKILQHGNKHVRDDDVSQLSLPKKVRLPSQPLAEG